MANVAALTGLVLEALHALRMEMGFVVSFVLFWGVSTLLRERPKPRGGKVLDVVKGRSASACDVCGDGAAAKRKLPAGRRGGTLPSEGSAEPFHIGRNPTPAQLCNIEWVLAAVQQLCRTQVPNAISLYHQARCAGLDLQQVTDAESAQLFTALASSAIRAGMTEGILGLLQDCQKGRGVTAALVSSCTKLCTSKQSFKDCLAIYDFVSKSTAVVIEDPTVWSCFLFAAVETRSCKHSSFFYERLRACGAPSSKDCTNMLRCALTEGDWKLALKMIHDMRSGGLEIDSIAYNTALATCVAANKIDEARALLEVMEGSAGIPDVVTYNTLSKGYAKAGRLDECFELVQHMRSTGIMPSQVTYGILMDCCINDKQLNKATEVFNEMIAAGLVMNTVLYTTLIKGFARAEQVDQAMKVYRQMCSSQEKGNLPDLITFSILIKANCDAGRLEDALTLLQTMKVSGLSPDEVVFNNLIGGCIRESRPELAKHLYGNMVEAGVRPSNATFSIFIRLYAQCKLLDDAMEMLRTEPVVQQVEIEPRLYVQLAQACLRERQGRRAIEAYTLMQERSTPTVAVHSSLLGMCSKLNMMDTAVDILELAVAHNSRVAASDVWQLHEVAVRKRKTACIEAIEKAIAQLGIGTGYRA